MMLKAICFLLLSTLVATHNTYDELIKKIGEKKIYESCFGAELYEEKMTEFHGYMKECKRELGLDSMAQPHNSAAFPTRSSTFNLLQLLQGQGSQQGQVLLIPLPAANRVARDLEEASSGRSKREAHFTSEKIEKLKKIATKHVDMAKCVLKKTRILNNYNEVQWSAIENKYRELDVEDELKDDLLEGFSKCRNFAMCMEPDEKSSEHFPMGLKQAITYFKCERYKKMSACCKKDLRMKPEMFELEGLDGFFANYDDDEKMHKILYLNAKFGPNPHALFE